MEGPGRGWGGGGMRDPGGVGGGQPLADPGGGVGNPGRSMGDSGGWVGNPREKVVHWLESLVVVGNLEDMW